MTTKKKKSAREKRVLIASIITAAMIVTSSTSAWFTSTDDVTNRLSANADYGVSIVESFAPPLNWVPGQEVDKDVYAVNTGNIAAFVKEEVTGTLAIKVERAAGTEKINDVDVPNFEPNFVQLTKAERYVKEAGAFLALKPESSRARLGDQIVAMDPTGNTVDGVPISEEPGYVSADPLDAYAALETDFTPDADGLYVFRRTITVDYSAAETFEYDGYYYKDGVYYKITNLEVVQDEFEDLANDGFYDDGNLESAKYQFVELVDEVINPVDLAYDGTRNALLATYDTGVANDNTLDALAAALDRAIEKYENANEAYERAVHDVNITDPDLAEKLAARDAAKDTLDAAVAALKDAEKAKDEAFANKVMATSKLEAAQTAFTNSENRLYGKEGGSETDYTTTSKKGLAVAAKEALDAAEANSRTAFEAAFTAWANTNQNAKGNSDLVDYTYTEFQGFMNNVDASANYYHYTELVAADKQASEAYDAEKKVYDDAKTELEDATAKKTAADNAYTTASDAYDTAVSTEADARSAYNTANTAYAEALAANNFDNKNLTKATAALERAKAAKDAAQAAYDEANAVGAPKYSSMLKIWIQLSDNVVTAEDGTNDKWVLKPIALDSNKAEFYYTGILDASETTSKLIDSVKLDEATTQDMYQSFDFDINVSLKSAQITIGDDKETILGTAATEELGATPTLINNKSIDTALVWTVGEGSGESTDDGYTPVEPTSVENYNNINPKSMGWYEKNGEGQYVLTNDELTQPNKTYYTKNESPQPDPDPDPVPVPQFLYNEVDKNMENYNNLNPSSFPWYEKSGTEEAPVYTATTDNSPDPDKTYYAQTANPDYQEP
jgi:predicted ribosomally synthesized peptide with SipW-like signal peptide